MQDPQPQGQYVIQLTFVSPEGWNMDQAVTAGRDLAESCGHERGLGTLSGTVYRARDDKPIEEFHFGSESIWRNQSALTSERLHTH